MFDAAEDIQGKPDHTRGGLNRSTTLACAEPEFTVCVDSLNRQPEHGIGPGVLPPQIPGRI